MRWRTTSVMYSVESVTTIATTIAVMAMTSLVFRLKAGMNHFVAVRAPGRFVLLQYSAIARPIAKDLVGRLAGHGGGVAVLFQLVVQGLQADSQHLGGARLIVVVCGQGLQDQHFFRFAHRGAHFQPDAFAVAGGPSHRHVPEI